LAANDSSMSATDTRHLLDWLDEQRQVDHERLITLSQSVDQLRKDLREQSSALTHAETTSISRSSTDMRSNEGVVVNLADQIARLERVVDEHVANQTRTSQADNAVRDRERRQKSELSQQVELLDRALGISTGRVSALAEEIRHERDSRAPIAQAIEEIQQIQTGVSTRVAAMEQMVRRMSSSLSVAEAGDEKMRTDVARVDNQTKLVDLRVTRELADIQRIVGEWKTRVDEQNKPVDGLTRLIGQLSDKGEASQARSNAIGETVDRLGRDVASLDAQAKSDRTAIQRGAESVELLARRLEATGSSIWQVGERISALVQDLDQVHLDLRGARQEIDSLTRRAELSEEGQRLFEGTQLTFALDLRTLRADARSWSDAVEASLDSETSAIVGRAEARFRRSVEHLRRSADEINQQVLELEADLT
jgi:chromosome segregation ATPase